MERDRRTRASNRYAFWNDAVGSVLTQYRSNSRRCLALHPRLRIALTLHKMHPILPHLHPRSQPPSAHSNPPRDALRFLKAPIHDKRWLSIRTLYPASTPRPTSGSTFHSQVKVPPESCLDQAISSVPCAVAR